MMESMALARSLTGKEAAEAGVRGSAVGTRAREDRNGPKPSKDVH